VSSAVTVLSFHSAHSRGLPASDGAYITAGECYSESSFRITPVSRAKREGRASD
jgi:hypothetical protein